MEEKKLLINNSKVNYKIAGSGPAILILHGWGGSSSSWVKVSEKIAAKGFKVICPDFPGFGDTNPPASPWNVSDYKEWVAEFIKSQNLDQFFLLGHSFGGRVVIKFVTSFPEKIKGLIFCDSAGIKHEPSFKERIISNLVQIGNKILSFKFLSKFENIIKKLFCFFFGSSDYFKTKGVMRETIKKVLTEDLQHYLKEIKAETLIIWGEKDKLVPLSDAYIFKKEINNSHLEILKNAGHSPHLEVPEELSDIIIRFLKLRA